MIKSVLNNFWLAIHDSKLIVQVGGVTIDKNNLEQIIDENFSIEGFESGTANDIESWNPKSYLKAVKYAKTSDQFQVFGETLDTVGSVQLFVYLEKGLPNRTAYFRKPRMVVFKRTNRKLNGYSAVFMCENEKGNEILRLMENPAHNEWKKENYPKETGNIATIARKAENEISDFINRSLESLSKIKTGKKIAFLGLEEYLSIPEDLLEQEEEFDFEGNVTNTNSGEMSKETTEDETGVQTTENIEPVKIKATINQPQEVKEETEIEANEFGEEEISVGGSNDSEGGDTKPTDSGDNIDKGKRAEDATLSKVLIKVGFRALAQKENNELFHILIINSDRQIDNSELELLVGSDNDRDDGIAVNYSNVGTIEKNTIKNVPLEMGNNIIKIRFVDNLKHSVKMKAYEIQ